MLKLVSFSPFITAFTDRFTLVKYVIIMIMNIIIIIIIIIIIVVVVVIIITIIHRLLFKE